MIQPTFSYLQHPENVMALYDENELCEDQLEQSQADVVVMMDVGVTINGLLRDLLNASYSGITRILVRRGHILRDAIQRMRRCTPDQLKNQILLQVTFIGEEAEDEGGPFREMFTLLFKQLKTSGYMCFETLSHNGEYRLMNHYKVIGWLIVLSVIHGGPAPRLFSPGVVRYLLGMSAQTGTDDLGLLKGNMEKLMSMTTANLRTNIDTLLEDRFEMGYTRPTNKVEDTDLPMILNLVSYHVSIESCQTELDQLIEGLELYGFLNMARKHPGHFAKLLEHGSGDKITADSLLTLLSRSYSDVGSNYRTKEEAVTISFSNFLIDVEAGEISTPMVNMDDGTESTYTITLQDIIFFVTECTEVPPLGFPQDKEPQLVFDHIRGDQLPHANTCASIMFIPMNKNNETYEGLKENLILAICGSPGFGQR